MHKKDFEQLIAEEKTLYLGNDCEKISQMRKSHHKRYTIWKYMYYFRCCQYWNEVRQNPNESRITRSLGKVKQKYYNKKRNIYSEKAGVEIGINCKIGRNCDIWHSGVVINGTVGDNCVFHGNNVIGNKGIGGELLTPTIGDNVDIGASAVVIGELNIADDCIIGAGSVVTKSFLNSGTIIAGVPGKELGLRR